MSILPDPESTSGSRRWKSHWLLPGACLLCRDASQDQLICPACAGELPACPHPACPICGEATPFGERCGRCLHDPPAFSRCHALHAYEFPIDRLIQAMKYAHQVDIAHWFGRRLAACLHRHDVDLLVPMPLHASRLRERGFNQAGEIATALAKGTNFTVDREILHKTRATPPQASLPLNQRQGNVRGAFACGRPLSGERILLIDDVLTTGASARECARLLRDCGAGAVEVAVIARATHGKIML